MLEIWKPVEGFGDKYLVSNYGRVQSLHRKPKIVMPSPNKKRHGYMYINLQYSGVRKNWLLHQLVAKIFLPNPDNKPQVNHIDFNPNNNRIDNLEWVTGIENINHTVQAGRTAHNYGEKAGNAKLTLPTVLSIYNDIRERRLTYHTIAKKHKTKYSNIAHIARGSRWAEAIQSYGR